MSDTIDFSTSASRNLQHDVEAARREEQAQQPLRTRHTFHSTEELGDQNAAPILKRRPTRASTSRTFRAIDAYPIRTAWHPGQEPGLDPSKPNGGRSEKPVPQAACEITVVDFSEDDMEMRYLDNATLPEWIAKEGDREEWSKCRWINVNGLSWDVIQELGKYKKLHKLAIEDMIHTKSRTKADWYSDHTYIVLTLQKLVHIHGSAHAEEEDLATDDDGSDLIVSPRKSLRSLIKRVQGNFHNRRGVGLSAANPSVPPSQDSTNGFVTAHTAGVANDPVQKLRTLQRYHGGVNVERMAFMEEHSALTKKDLAVCAEQVSIFLLADNTVLSFFESSAEDIETPILSRLSTPDTILRRSCDASMLVQSIIDAIIDLAMPVTTAYQDIIGDLELDVLTEPDIKHTKDLYIITSEITTMRNFIAPIASLVAALRDHRSEHDSASISPDRNIGNKAGVRISSLTRTYLGDVEDHCVMISQTLDQLHSSAAGMIDLIFNTISAFQNESMKQLTAVTIVFLPCTFVTGYFGMNFTMFTTIDTTEAYFWQIAVPVVFATVIWLMKDVILRWVVKTYQRRGISRRRKWRLQREALAKKGR